MESRINYVLVGIFVLVLGAALVAGVLWLTAGVTHERYEIYAVYPQESVSGLSVGAAVNYNGVPVGRVAQVGLDPKKPVRVRLLLQIKQGTPIKHDTVATVEVLGLTGVANINLTGSTPQSPALRAQGGEEYPVIKSQPSLFGRLDQVLAELSRNVKEVTDKLNDLLSVDNRRAIHETLAQLQALTANLAARSPQINAATDDLAATLRNARQASTELPATIEQVRQSAAAIERMARDMTKATDAIRQVAVSSGGGIERFTGQTLPELSVLLGELRQTAAQARRLLSELEREPQSLLYGAPRRPPGPGEAHRP